MITLEIRFYSIREIKRVMNTTRISTVITYLTVQDYHFEWIPIRGVRIIELPEGRR